MFNNWFCWNVIVDSDRTGSFPDLQSFDLFDGRLYLIAMVFAFNDAFKKQSKLSKLPFIGYRLVTQ